MPEKILYEYAIIRYVPKVEREEFLNVGVIMYAKQSDCVLMLYDINEKRLSAFSKEADIDLLREHLESFEKIVAGNKNCGSIAQLDTASRFRWLTAIRSSVIQTSRPHPGFSKDLETTVNKLFREIVL